MIFVYIQTTNNKRNITNCLFPNCNILLFLGFLDTTKMDIIEQLLQRDLTDICFQILSHLDSETFGNCRLVCQLWNQFIEHYFYNFPKGQEWLKQKLVSNFLNETYQPKEDKVISKRCIADIKADQKTFLFPHLLVMI